MRVLFDTNVLLDVLLAREPFVRDAAALFALSERRTMTGLVSAISVPTVHYIVERARGRATAREAVDALLRVFEVAPVARPELDVAAAFTDYEDGVVEASARSADAQALVTRDATGFEASSLDVYSPAELLAALRAA